ncbi:MAG: isochorismatase family protein [Planctomycetota bacterium]|nr:isochorismatase family protein [Planctomycetota bacterium]
MALLVSRRVGRILRLEFVALFVVSLFFSAQAVADGPTLSLRLRPRAEVAPGSGQFREVTNPAVWNAKETAIVICDMWNNHYCRNAARRVAEMAPRMNEVIRRAREQGVLIIHSPSGCMDQYADSPQRKLAQSAPKVETKLPLQGWCHLDDKHESQMPVTIGQPCDDDGVIRPAVRYFQRQIDTLEIVAGDAITDSAEAFYLMKQRGIRNIIIMGVHTNMCVLGRPFGIRQMIYQGQNVALMRDMTDTMYNPRDEPFVNHFTGNDLVFEHIERHWCPTITSADILGDKPFRFPGDRRKHVVIVMAEEGYGTATSLPPFALTHLGADFKITCVYANSKNRNDIPGIEVLDDADVAIWSIRRRTLPQKQLDVFRRFIAAGKPLVAIRTTSHGFSLSNGAPPTGLADWPEFDQQVLGGNYSGDLNNKAGILVSTAEGVSGHSILTGIRTDEFAASASLYKTGPLAVTAAPLLLGRAEGVGQVEPVAWTHQQPNGGRVFYTSLGHADDFKIRDFQFLLRNAVYWAANLPVPAAPPEVANTDGC